jgi:hypothetical protein
VVEGTKAIAADALPNRSRLKLINATITLALLSVFAILNITASVCLIRSRVYSSTQKALQIILVWLIPLVGATVVLSVWAHDRKTSSRDPVHSGEGPWLPGIGPMSDSSHPTNSFGDGGAHGGDGGGQSD